MATKDDLQKKVNDFFKEKYEIEKTTIVPSTDYSKLTFGNKGLIADLTFLFVDIRKSSLLHDTYGHINAARIYQSFHDINSTLIKYRDGFVRAFDGDRIMGVFSGNSKNNNAVLSALNIRWAVGEILNKHFQNNTGISIGIGIDTGETLITKVGKARDTSDLVWVGKACNYASHLCQEANNSIIISPTVYSRLLDPQKLAEGKNMWTKTSLSLKNNVKIEVYQSTYWWGNF